MIISYNIYIMKNAIVPIWKKPMCQKRHVGVYQIRNILEFPPTLIQPSRQHMFIKFSLACSLIQNNQ